MASADNMAHLHQQHQRQPDDNVFGPRVDPSQREFDFTLYFEDVIFTCLPVAIFLLSLPLACLSLYGKPRVIKRSKLQHAKCLIYFCTVVLQASFPAIRCMEPLLQTVASLAADTLSLVGTLLAAVFAWFHHQSSVRPSTLLAVYFSITVILEIPRLRTIWLVTGRKDGVYFALVLACNSALILESISKGSKHLRTTEQRSEYTGVGSEPFSGLWTRIGYVWLWATVRRGYTRILSVEDLPGIDPQLRSEAVHAELEREWVSAIRKEQQSKSALRRKGYRLVVACFRAYWTAFLSGALPRLCLMGFTFAQPFMISALTVWIQNKESTEREGRGMIGAYGLIYLGMTASSALYWY